MDNNILIAVIAVSGTLAGVIVSTIGTYFIQSKSYERQRKSERESEERKIKRELISNRLNVVEEAVNLMMYLTGRTISLEVEMMIYNDKDIEREKSKKLEDIGDIAWAAVIATGSEDLKDNYTAITSAFWENMRQGTITTETWDKAYKAYVKIIKIMDRASKHSS